MDSVNFMPFAWAYVACLVLFSCGAAFESIEWIRMSLIMAYVVTMCLGYYFFNLILTFLGERLMI